LHRAIVIVYSRGVLQPSGTRRFENKVSKLPPLRPVLGNGDPLTKLLGNALTSERVLQRPAPSGQSIGREFDIQPVSNCRGGARLMGIRATWPAQRRT
jgi:hypothetical protein